MSVVSQRGTHFRSPRGKAGYASCAPPGPAQGSAAQAVGEWGLFRRTISGHCCCFLVHQQLPGVIVPL